jgi:hypothetical protein
MTDANCQSCQTGLSRVFVFVAGVADSSTYPRRSIRLVTGEEREQNVIRKMGKELAMIQNRDQSVPGMSGSAQYEAAVTKH